MTIRIVIAGLLFVYPHITMAQTAFARSKECITHVPFLFAGKAQVEPSTIMMNNDGGWCGFDNSTLPHGTATFLATLNVTRPPAHGEVVIAASPNPDKTRVYYKPAKDFIGEDHFAGANMTTNNERQITVTVAP